MSESSSPLQIALRGFNYTAVEPATKAILQGFIVLNAEHDFHLHHIERMVYDDKHIQVINITPDVLKVFNYDPFALYIGSTGLVEPDIIEPTEELIEYCSVWSVAKKESCAHFLA